MPRVEMSLLPWVLDHDPIDLTFAEAHEDLASRYSTASSTTSRRSTRATPSGSMEPGESKGQTRRSEQ